MGFYLGKEQYSSFDGFVELRGDLDDCYTKVVWESVRFVKGAKANSAVGIVSKVVGESKIEAGTKCYLDFHTAPYTGFKDKQKVTLDPTPLENFYNQHFPHWGLPQTWKGSISLVSDLDTLADAAKSANAGDMWSLEAIDTQLDIPEPKESSGGGKGYAPKETEYERIKARERWFIETIKSFEDEATNFYLATLALENIRKVTPETYNEFKEWMRIILSQN